MNYAKHYQTLMDRAESRTLTGYSERHHVVPRCLDKSSKHTVRLTPEEHYVAHQLLVKLNPGNQLLVFAAWRMTHGAKRNNKGYGWLRRLHAEAMRVQSTGVRQSPETVAKRMAGSIGRIRSEETLKNMRAAQKVRHELYPCTDETRKKQSDAHKGVPLTLECKANMSLARMGHATSDATRWKLRLAALGNTRSKGRKASEEERANLSRAQTGRKRSDATKSKIASSIKAYFADPDNARKIEATSRKQSESMKVVWAKRKAEREDEVA